MSIPLLRPRPPRLSNALEQLVGIEESGVFTNFGPLNCRFEEEVINQLFDGVGACTMVCNATLGLMLAIKAQLPSRSVQPAYALMPAYTFAATAHAALWNGLVPLFCDVDPQTWMPSADAEDAAFRHYGSQIAVVVPYATFGANLDLEYYSDLSRRHAVPVVVDAAASLGSRDANGKGFARGQAGLSVFSMHATKTFATTEAGLVYSADVDLVAKVRTMSNFGFGRARHATMAGLNAKASEVAALSACLKLDGFSDVVQRRSKLVARYKRNLPEFRFQKSTGLVQAHQFCSVLLPDASVASRDDVMTLCSERGIALGSYFDPHLARQSFFKENSIYGDLPVADWLSARCMSLPLYDDMLDAEVDHICEILTLACQGALSSRL